MRHARYLELAIKAAHGSSCKQRHGAIVVSGGNILSTGINIQKNDPAFVNWNSAHIHAEIAALRRARWPKKATVYIARIDARGNPAYSKPCIKCQAVLDAHGYDSVWT